MVEETVLYRVSVVPSYDANKFEASRDASAIIELVKGLEGTEDAYVQERKIAVVSGLSGLSGENRIFATSYMDYLLQDLEGRGKEQGLNLAVLYKYQREWRFDSVSPGLVYCFTAGLVHDEESYESDYQRSTFSYHRSQCEVWLRVVGVTEAQIKADQLRRQPKKKSLKRLWSWLDL